MKSAKQERLAEQGSSGEYSSHLTLQRKRLQFCSILNSQHSQYPTKFTFLNALDKLRKILVFYVELSYYLKIRKSFNTAHF